MCVAKSILGLAEFEDIFVPDQHIYCLVAHGRAYETASF